MGKLEINDLREDSGGDGGVECEKNLGRSTAIHGSRTLMLRYKKYLLYARAKFPNK